MLKGKGVFFVFYWIISIIKSNAMNQNETDSFFKWGKKHKVFFDNRIQLNPSTNENPLPYFTSLDIIQKDTKIISIPSSFFINTKTIQTIIKNKEIKSLWKSLLDIENPYIKYHTTKEMLFIALTVETYMRTHPKKNKFYQRYKKYFKFYQYYSFDNYPLYYNEDELSFISGTNLALNINTARNSINEEISIITNDLKINSIIPEDYTRYRIFTLSNSHIIDNTTTVIPFIDLFPHDKMSPYVKWEYNNVTKSLDIITIREIPKDVVISMEAKNVPNSVSLLYYGYTVENNELVSPYIIETINKNRKKKLNLNTLEIQNDTYDIARQNFDKNIIDTYKIICSKIKGCKEKGELGAYEIMRDNVKDYLEVYDKFTPGNFNMIFYSKRKREDVKKVINIEKKLILNRVAFLNRKIELIKSENGDL